MSSEIVFDVESYRDVFLVGMKRLSDGKTLIMEESARERIDRDHLRSILLKNTMIGYNSLSYDSAVIWKFLDGATVEQVKQATNRIIGGGLKYWEVEDALGIRIPWDFKRRHIDLIEPQPNPFASLKALYARLHGKRLRELPYDPEARLDFEQIDNLRAYLHNDLAATEALWHALAEPMELRRAIGESIGQNVMSKSDGQMGMALIKKRAEALLGREIPRAPGVVGGRTFRYRPPAYLRFDDPVLRGVLERIAEHDFIVGPDGKVALPDWLAETPVTVAGMTYQMGIGGLHSTEANRGLVADDDHALVDFDVASYYPAIILTLGLYPEAVGPQFLDVYAGIRADRIAAKKAKNKAVDKALKLSLNSLFGNLGSRWSFVYAPHLLVAVTLTGQLALLMLIERAARAGMQAVSGNTDGVVLRVPRDLYGGLTGDRPNPSPLADLIEGWERDTGFDLEGTEYAALYSQSVNSYFAVKVSGGHKRKGPLANPWSSDPNDADARAALMKNPQMTICSDAALARIKHGVPVRETIEACRDIRQFVTVIKVTKGATWQGDYLGKTVRYYWGTRGEEILEAVANPKTGHFKKVPKTEGAVECMTLPDEFPDDIDYDRYVAEAESILKELGFFGTPRPPERRIRLTRANRIDVLKAWMVAP